MTHHASTVQLADLSKAESSICALLPCLISYASSGLLTHIVFCILAVETVRSAAQYTTLHINFMFASVQESMSRLLLSSSL